MVRMVLKNWKGEWKLYWKEDGKNAIPFFVAALLYGRMVYTDSEVLSLCFSAVFLFLGLREIFPNRLPKWLFVIPMSRKEKEQYLYIKFGIKMGLAFLIGIVMCILSCKNGISVLNQISILFFWLMFSVFVSIDNQVINKKEIAIKIEEFLCIFALTVEEILRDVEKIWSNIVIVVILFLVTGISMTGIQRIWKRAFRTAMDYELWNIKRTKGSMNL